MKIAMCGCGALGSQIALHIATEDMHFWLIDDDTVGPENIGTSAFYHRQIGLAKVYALGGMLQQKTNAQMMATWWEFFDRTKAARFLRDSDLIIDTFDNAESRNLTHEIATELECPIVHVGVSQARTGAIIGGGFWQEMEPSGERNEVCTHLLGKQILRFTSAVAAAVIEDWLHNQQACGILITTEQMAVITA